MIEPVMFIGIGFLVAGLLVIGFIPLVHARAVRLTMRRLEALTPLSMAEIAADKDQLRAEFAMSTRRLEMSIEQLNAKSTSQLAEISRKNEAIGRLKVELGDTTAALFALEAKEKQLVEERERLEADLAAKTGALAQAERALADTRAELAQMSANYHEASVAAEGQRVELLALRAQSEALKGQIESFENETKELQDRLRNKIAETEWLSQQLAEERARVEPLANRVGELERQLIAQTTESEVLGRRVEEVIARLDEQRRLLAEREFMSDRLRNEAASAQKSETKLRAEKSLIEEQLSQSQEERIKLEREIAAMKRDAEGAWANERMENTVLRERINEVAAEIARLTAALEGPGSPINAILNRDGARAANGSNGASVSIAPGAESKGTLADRIRALQSRASRLVQASGA